MTEQEALDILATAERELIGAKANLVKARRTLTDAESLLIETKLTRDRAKEALRVFRNTTPKYEPSKRDEEIEQFKLDHPELVAWARERDGFDDKPE
jgi:hypothetical protein